MNEGRTPRVSSAIRSHPLRSFALWVALPAALVFGAVCMLVLLSLHLMSREINRVEAERSGSAFAAAIESLVAQLGESTADEATWTEAYINVYITPNPAWIDGTWGATARISETYDTAIITDGAGRIEFGETSRGPLAGAIGDHFSGTAELLAELDAAIAARGDDATASHLARSTTGVAALAAAVVHGNTGQASVPRDQRRILWLARRLDNRLLHQVATRFQLPLPHLAEPAPGDESMPLLDAAGDHVGTIAWQPRRPGDPAFASVASLAAIIMLVTGALTFAVLAAFRSAIKSRAAADRRDWHNARFDAATGLPNGFALEEHLRTLFPRRRRQLPMAALQVGIDNFAEIVASYGRETGDGLLNALADMIDAKVGGEAAFARSGPAQFVLARAGDDAAQIMRGFAEAVLAMAAEVVVVGELKLKVGLSIGLADTSVRKDDVGEVLRMAETALARARETGGNHIVVYDSSIVEERLRRVALQVDIRRGLEAGEFDLEYQPIIDFSSRSIIGVEALMRWPRRAGGAMTPAEFIPAAEASGLIDDLGMFALRRATEEIGPFENLKLSVNVSTAQLRNPRLADVITSALAEWHVAPGRLQLEVTESFLVAQPERAKRVIEELRALGVVIALDDFGTGYSSVGYLRQFRFDRVKLDRSLVADIDRDPVQAALVESTMVYAFAMGLAVTAEGVERREEAAVLNRLGCREFQGYLFARPMGIAQLSRLLAEEPKQRKAG